MRSWCWGGGRGSWPETGKAASPVPWEGGTAGGDLRGSYSCPTLTISMSVMCDFSPRLFWVRILKKDIFMVIVARLFYYIFM